MTELGIKIHELRKQGKSYNEIVKELGCNLGTVCYYINPNRKQKVLSNGKNIRKNPLIQKISSFLRLSKQENKRKDSGDFYNNKINLILKNKIQFYCNRRCLMNHKQNFGIKDVLSKIGKNPTCYLTGLPIDLTKSNTYNFDHIIPASRGGVNSLDNLGICTKKANMSKTDMTPDEFINLCKMVLEHNGYDVNKK